MNNGEFRIERKIGIPQPDKLHDFGDIMTVGTFCFDEDGKEVFYAHHFQCPYGRALYVETPKKDKKPWAVYFVGARIDPKRILEGGIQYRLVKGQK